MNEWMNRGVRQAGKKVVRELRVFLEWKNKGGEQKLRKIEDKGVIGRYKKTGDGPGSGHEVGLMKLDAREDYG